MEKNENIQSNERTEKIAYWKLVQYEDVGLPVNRQTIEEILEDAFSVWTKYIKLSIIKIPEDKPAEDKYIEIFFVPKDHKCLEAFDGKGGTLAHSTFPYNYSKKLFIHFDIEENWIFNSDISVFNILSNNPVFFNVAVHEIGHVLGLKHNNKLDSVMNEKYERFFTFPIQEDIINLQKIYGATNYPISDNSSFFVVFVKQYYKTIILFVLSKIIETIFAKE